jgi:hypothetical protein
MKFKIIASLLVIVVIGALAMVMGDNTNTKPITQTTPTEFGADAVNSLRQ